MRNPQTMAAALAWTCAVLTTPLALGADISQPPVTIELVDGGGFFGRLITGAASGDTFTDRYTFTTGGAASVVADLFSYRGRTDGGVDITAMDLYSSAGTQVASGTPVAADGIEQWQLAAGGLAADTYQVLVSGNLNSSSPAVYSASLAVSAVPEPATMTMLLGGLLLIGATRRRCKVQ